MCTAHGGSGCRFPIAFNTRKACFFHQLVGHQHQGRKQGIGEDAIVKKTENVSRHHETKLGMCNKECTNSESRGTLGNLFRRVLTRNINGMGVKENFRSR